MEQQAVQVAPPPTSPNMIDGLYMGKYNIYDPATVSYVERTDFLKGICGHIDHEETLEDILYMGVNPKKVPRDDDYYYLQDLAANYVMYRNKGARLPKFSRWVTGMFAGNAAYAKILADEGQLAAKRKIIMSVDVVDILRCADTPHFASCFGRPPPGKTDNYGWVRLGYDKIPVRIAEECPGIGIVYVDDEDGKMMGRQWMHHAKIKETGEDICVLTPSTYGCLEGKNVARLMRAKGIRMAVPHGKTPIEYVGCFTKEVHHDLPTWTPNPTVTLLD